jgi:OmcA/MtrC family decaheme c-type cytochrome
MSPRSALDSLPKIAGAHLYFIAAGLAALLAACTGSTGSAGAAGPAGPPGPPGPSGSGTATDVTSTSVTSITGTITSATISSTPVVKFSLADQDGTPLKGLPAADISFAIAKLTPGVNGQNATWQSYLVNSVTPPPHCPTGVVGTCPTAPANQATTEKGTSGTLVDNGDGTYQYTFKTVVTNVAGVTYDAALTHRVGFEIRNLAQANNGVYTFQPSTGATTGIFMNEIVETPTCNACHSQLAEHGGARVDTQYCVICHNPGTTDPDSGNPLDMKQMIHKIHSGNTPLPSIAAAGGNTTPTVGIGYWIVGKSSVNNFNTIVYPQSTTNCTTCHNQNDPQATQAGNYASVPTIEACGACHDTTTFSGANLTHKGGAATDLDCKTCHGISAGFPVTTVHVNAVEAEAKNFQFIVNNVKFTTSAPCPGPGPCPVVNFSVVNPTNKTPYNILTDAPFAGTDPGTGKPVCASAASLSLKIAWETSDYTNWSNAAPAASSWGQPISVKLLAVPGCTFDATPMQQPDKSWTVTSPFALPVPPMPPTYCPPAPASTTACPAVANVGVGLEGRAGVSLSPGAAASKIPVTTVVGYGNVSGQAPVPRRVVVSITKCDACHHRIEEHGSNRNDEPQECVLCHNPASTDGEAPEQSINFRFMIHAIHASSSRAAAGVPTSFGGTSFNVAFPGQINNCGMCHNSGTYYPVDPTIVQATTFDDGLGSQSVATPGNPISTSANMTVCTSCHVDSTAKAHMVQNGGSTDVLKDFEGRTIPGVTVETCTVCHGPGAVADLAVVHKIPVADR